jgi:hypothetical protein
MPSIGQTWVLVSWCSRWNGHIEYLWSLLRQLSDYNMLLSPLRLTVAKKVANHSPWNTPPWDIWSGVSFRWTPSRLGADSTTLIVHLMQRSTWTLYPPGPGSTWILRRQIFFHRWFSGEPTQIMRSKFVEYLGTDCFHFFRIPVELSVVSTSNTKCRPTKPSSNAQCTDNFI